MKKTILALLLAAIPGTGIKAITNEVTVAWDPNPETNIVEYLVYSGIVGATQTNTVSAGTNTLIRIRELPWTSNVWFYVTAKNSWGLESDPSEVLEYEVPAEPVKPSAPQNLQIELRLLSANSVLGPFEEKTRFVYNVEPEFFITGISIASVTTNDVNMNLEPPTP